MKRSAGQGDAEPSKTAAQSQERLEGTAQFEVSFERSEIHECGAALLTVLTAPQGSVDDERADRFTSLCAKGIELEHLMNPDAETPITVKPKYVFRDREIVDRDVRYVARRLGERMVAGRMAIAFLQRAELGPAYRLPKGLERLSLNALAAFVSEDAGQADATNVLRRIWKPSRPVIHLAAAAARIGQRLRQLGHPTWLETFLFSRPFVEEVVADAERLRGLIAMDPKFPVKAERLVRFRLR